jgi:hypothetical protein
MNSVLGSTQNKETHCGHNIEFLNGKAGGIFFTSKLDLNLRKQLVKCYIWNITLYGAEN